MLAKHLAVFKRERAKGEEPVEVLPLVAVGPGSAPYPPPHLATSWRCGVAQKPSPPPLVADGLAESTQFHCARLPLLAHAPSSSSSSIVTKLSFSANPERLRRQVADN